jgi:hypothetical protein
MMDRQSHNDRRIEKVEMEDCVWYAETADGIGAYRWDREAAIQAALENERQASILDAKEDLGKRHPQSRYLTQEELSSLIACGLVSQLVKCGAQAVYELTPEGRVLLEHSVRMDDVG